MHRILHITDLHISDPDDPRKEYLRKGYYKEYLKELHECFRGRDVHEVDAAIITGDFIDKGNINNFDFVHTVIDYLANVFSITKQCH